MEFEIDAVPSPSPPKRRVWLHVLLFLATVLTTTAVGARFHRNFVQGRPAYEAGTAFNPLNGVWRHPERLLDGLAFSITLLFILGCHEYGHIAACQFYEIDATYPFFIPAPTLIGTMGAFIRIKSMFRTRRALFDVGIWGPFAGFIAALPVLLVGLAKSRVVTGIYVNDSVSFGSPPLILLLNRILNPGVREFDLLLHPVARAAWVGLFATALNLLPAGQLDGGHILYALSPRWHKISSRTLAALLAFPMLPRAAMELLSVWWPYLDDWCDRMDSVYWPGWFLWGVLLTFLWRHPPVYDAQPIDPRRRRQALLALLIFVLCFTPVPFQQF
jgi:membrane-associated protease RseP (regulator of RpoE activity)